MPRALEHLDTSLTTNSLSAVELPKQKIILKLTELFSRFKPLFQKQKYFTELLESKPLLLCRKDTSILLGEDSPFNWTQNLVTKKSSH